MKTINGRTIIIGIILSIFMAGASSFSAKAANNIQSFESGVPSNWNSEAGSIETTTKHFKDREHALLWKWQANDKLTVEAEKNLLEAGKSKSGGIIVWLYNENPRQDKLTFNFGTTEQIKNQNPQYTFDCYLNFSGWRAVWVSFRGDAVNPSFIGKRQGDLQEMEVVAPNLEGTVYFDLLEFRNSMYWCRSQDYQVPIQRSTDEKGDIWQRNYYYIKKKPYLPLEPINDTYRQAFRTIEQRLNNWFYDEGRYTNTSEMKARKKSLDSYIKSGVNKYDTLNIQRHADGSITGKPLFGSSSPYADKGNMFGRGVADTIFLPLAFDYKLNGNQDSLDKLYTLFDYYHDQGWAEGSGLGSLNHETNRSTGYFVAVYLIKEELRQTNRLQREMGAVNWYSNFGKLFVDPSADYESSTADELRTHSLNRLLYVLLMEDTPEKVQAMKSYVNWLNGALRLNANLADTIKPDYIGFHHEAPYMGAYAPHGYHLSSVIIYLLHDTTFKISNESQNHLKQALITQDILSNETEIPIALRGRIVGSTPISIMILPSYAYLALSGNPETNEPIDKEMAGIFIKNWNIDNSLLQSQLIKQAAVKISYVDPLGAITSMLDVLYSGYSAAPEQEGFWAKPYGGLAVKRQNHWMAMVKGWSKYLWDYEMGSKENVYGRYLSYGTLQIMSKGTPITDKANGYDYENGWDWNRMPGATTKHLALQELSGEKSNAHRTYSDETFLGSVKGKENNGVWAMSMHDLTFDNTFYAKKSVFFLGDEMILLGSDISNKDNQNNTETTLFQSSLGDDITKPIHIGTSGTISQFPYQNTINSGADWLIDPYDNGYYIPNADGVKVMRDSQNSRNSSDKNATTGNYASAWIDHGAAPANGEYEYVIKVETTPEEMAAYAKNVNYEVLQKDSTAHIVKSNGTNTIGYAIFEADTPLNTQEYITETDTPVLAMITPAKDGISLSISDPDLRVSNSNNMAPSTMKKTQITLAGKWSLKNTSNDFKIVSATEDCTIIEFNGIDGKTINMELQKEMKSQYSVTVIDGVGTGMYHEGEVVNIESDAESDMKTFVEWTSEEGIAFDNPNSSRTSFVMPAKDVTITANYIEYCTITATAYEGGTITPGTMKIEKGTSQTYQIAPDKGYEIEDVVVDGKSVGQVSEYTFIDIRADATIQAHFKEKTQIPDIEYYTIKVITNQGGRIVPGTMQVKKGDNQTYRITPDEGYEIGDVTVNGKSVGQVSEYTFTDVRNDAVIQVYFKMKAQIPDTEYFTITATASEGGRITPGTIKVKKGQSLTYQIIPNSGYEIDDVQVSGKSVGKRSKYTFANVEKSEKIHASFRKRYKETTVTENGNTAESVTKKSVSSVNNNSLINNDSPVNRDTSFNNNVAEKKTDESVIREEPKEKQTSEKVQGNEMRSNKKIIIVSAIMLIFITAIIGIRIKILK